MSAGSAEPDRRWDWRARFLDEIPAAVALFDHDLRYVAASQSWVAAFGLSAAALAGLRHDEVAEAGGDALEEVQRRALAGKNVEHYGALPGALPGAHHDDPARPSRRPVFSARPHRDADGAIVGVVVALRQNSPFAGDDVPPPLDALTGLADRHEFGRRLRQALAQPDADRRTLTVFAININRFRNINNLHGTGVGDRVLRVIAERLVAGTRAQRSDDASGDGRLRERDMIARLGGDEFGIVCGPPALTDAAAQAFAERVLRLVQNPIAIGDLSLRLTASIGFMMTTSAHRDENDALRDLDIALQRAKALGPSKASSWEPSLTRTATRRYSLTDQLRRAFDHQEFLLHYQPVVRLSDNRMVGAEALLRWGHPSEGLIPPAGFLHVLEETGLIVEVGGWVIRETARQIEAWRELYGRDPIEWVSVNVSPRQFDDPAPLLASLNKLHDRGFPVRRLKLEITETTFMRNPDTTRAVLAEIRDLGIRIGIDDFGTGYSSLNALRRYPVDTIKIDAEFIAHIGTAEGDELALALLNIARMYDAAIVAEGIETAHQRDFLREAGCGFGQGFLFGEPMEGALLGNHALAHAQPPARPRLSRLTG
jgi:diguanylate cyclase (GGDEF)-like protein